MKDRIKKIRKNAGLGQQEFGERIGLKPTTITCYEKGTRKPNDAILKNICREFHVSRDWLLTGEGEMYIEQSAMFTELLSAIDDSDDKFIKAFIETYMELDKDSRDILEYTVMKLAHKLQDK